MSLCAKMPLFAIIASALLLSGLAFAEDDASAGLAPDSSGGSEPLLLVQAAPGDAEQLPADAPATGGQDAPYDTLMETQPKSIPLPLSITIESPIDSTIGKPTLFNVRDVPLNFTASGATTCWYDLGGDVSYPLPGCANTVLKLDDADYVLNLWAQDDEGNEDLASTWFSVDTIPPTVTITFPADQSTIGTGPFSLTFTAIDPLPTSGVKMCWYDMGGVTNYPLPNCTPTTLNLLEDNYVINLYAADNAGNVDFASVWFRVKNIPPPSVAITAPVAAVPGDQIMLASGAVQLAFVTGPTVVKCYYDLGGSQVYELPGCNNTTLSLGDNDYVLNLYAEDAEGRYDFDSTWFSVKTPSGPISPPSTPNGGSNNGGGSLPEPILAPPKSASAPASNTGGAPVQAEPNAAAQATAPTASRQASAPWTGSLPLPSASTGNEKPDLPLAAAALVGLDFSQYCLPAGIVLIVLAIALIAWLLLSKRKKKKAQ